MIDQTTDLLIELNKSFLLLKLYFQQVISKDMYLFEYENHIWLIIGSPK